MISNGLFRIQTMEANGYVQGVSEDRDQATATCNSAASLLDHFSYMTGNSCAHVGRWSVLQFMDNELQETLLCSLPVPFPLFPAPQPLHLDFCCPQQETKREFLWTKKESQISASKGLLSTRKGIPLGFFILCLLLSILPQVRAGTTRPG